MSNKVIVSVHSELSPCQVVLELLSHCPVKGQKLQLEGAVVGIVPFCRMQAPTCIGYDMLSAVLVLSQDCSQSLAASIRVHYKWQ